MKIVHTADSHLGHVGQGIQPRVDHPFVPGVSVTQRFADILVAFDELVRRVVDDIHPDVVLHAGDLFDSSRPNPQTLDFAMREIRRITEASIPFIVVEGHHSWPRERQTGHVLDLLRHVPGVRVITTDYTDVRLDELGLLIHALPHQALDKGDVPPPDRIDPSLTNVLVTHGVADGLPFYRTWRPAPPVPSALTDASYDYIALGHHHRFAQANLHQRAFYAGSPTMITWADFHAGHQFGFLVIDIDEVELTVTPHILPGRALHAYGLDDASDMGADDILDKLHRQTQAVPPRGAYCRARIAGVEPSVRRELQVRVIDGLYAGAAGLQREIHTAQSLWSEVESARVAGGTPEERYEAMVAELKVDESVRQEVFDLGRKLLDSASDAIVGEAG